MMSIPFFSTSNGVAKKHSKALPNKKAILLVFLHQPEHVFF
jgi:hypothetical protein